MKTLICIALILSAGAILADEEGIAKMREEIRRSDIDTLGKWKAESTLNRDSERHDPDRITVWITKISITERRVISKHQLEIYTEDHARLVVDYFPGQKDEWNLRKKILKGRNTKIRAFRRLVMGMSLDQIPDTDTGSARSLKINDGYYAFIEIVRSRQYFAYLYMAPEVRPNAEEPNTVSHIFDFYRDFASLESSGKE